MVKRRPTQPTLERMVGFRPRKQHDDFSCLVYCCAILTGERPQQVFKEIQYQGRPINLEQAQTYLIQRKIRLEQIEASHEAVRECWHALLAIQAKVYPEKLHWVIWDGNHGEVIETSRMVAEPYRVLERYQLIEAWKVVADA